MCAAVRHLVTREKKVRDLNEKHTVFIQRHHRKESYEQIHHPVLYIIYCHFISRFTYVSSIISTAFISNSRPLFHIFVFLYWHERELICLLNFFSSQLWLCYLWYEMTLTRAIHPIWFSEWERRSFTRPISFDTHTLSLSAWLIL